MSPVTLVTTARHASGGQPLALTASTGLSTLKLEGLLGGDKAGKTLESESDRFGTGGVFCLQVNTQSVHFPLRDPPYRTYLCGVIRPAICMAVHSEAMHVVTTLFIFGGFGV